MGLVHTLIPNREIYYVTDDQTVLQAVKYMVERNVGAVPVMRDHELVGIFSERDLMKRVVAEQLDPQSTRVREVMTADPLVVAHTETIDKCRAIMQQHSFRHLPVCDGKKLRGLISMRDLLAHEVTEKDHEVQHMRAYIQQNS